MARSDRLLRLLQAMRQMLPPITASRLADETGVSLRSLYRDIDSLRAAGARIEGERGYGYRLVEDFALPPQTFDRLEIEALVLGLGEVQTLGDPELAAAARSTLAKVAATLPDEREQQMLHAISQVYRPGARYALDVDMGLIRQCCWREETLAIGYRDADGAVTAREIKPLALAYHQNVLAVLAWCCLREDFRIFRADRIADPRPTGKSFRPQRVSLLRDYLEKLNARR
ncbi:helix-turn-helix transcriptional regulator [Devosia sediminis]|uniref:YafY family transcriptional regulator n=1 Tax=Devosia sediminis TaxID=2798801 RepID=A0A934IS48_9HYPH|nr:YafY family protein [Devosia sediminis]MBJ3783277.1 YafY family transcriptional regulator [Devosia sediminis]